MHYRHIARYGLWMGLLLLAIVPAQALAAGTCRERNCPCTQEEEAKGWHNSPEGCTDCDAETVKKARQEYEQKKKAALDLYADAEDTIKHSTDDVLQFLKDFAEGTGEATAVKGPVVVGLKAFKKYNLRQIEKVAYVVKKSRYAAAAAGAGVALETIEWGGVVITLEQLRQLMVLEHQAYQQMEIAKKQVDAANKLYDEAVAALDTALIGERACLKMKLAIESAKSLNDQAKEIRETWENNDVIYLDPSTGKTYDAAGALEKIKETLSGTGSRARLSGGMLPVAFITAESKNIVLTDKQLDRLIADLEHARKFYAEGMDSAIKWFGQVRRTSQRLGSLTSRIRKFRF